MTVGVPEINLDTWGLKYVKKKRDPNEPLANETSPSQGIDKPTGSGTPASPKHTGLPESKRPRSEGYSNFQSTKPSENIQATTRISDADVKTPDSPKQVHGTQGSDKKRQYTHGKEVPVGSDTGIEVSGLGETGKPKKLTTGTPAKGVDAKGKPIGGKKVESSDTKNVQNPAAVAAGREASHESGIQSVEARSGKDRVGNPVDPEKKGKPTHSALPKVKAEMALAIIKCKLLKMKTKKKDFIEEGRPTRPAYRKDDDDEKVEKGTKDYGSDNSGSAQIPDTGDGKPTSDKQSVKDPPTSPSRYRADESEVTSYGEGASGNQYGGKTTHGEKGAKQLNVEGKIGRSVGHEDIESRASTKSDEIVEKAIELINEAYDEMKKSNPVIVSDPKGKPFCANCGRDHGKEDAKALEGTDDQQQRMVSGTRGGNKPSCPSCGHRPAKKEGADGGTSTTSSEGGFNHVYSDVHEKKKQEDDEDNKERNRRSEDEDSKEDWAKHN